MTAQDRRKLSILIILLVVLGLTLVLGYRLNQPASAGDVPPGETRPSANTPAANEARIRLDLVEEPEGSQAGDTNIFQYRQRKPAPEALKPGVGPGSLAPVPPPVVTAQPVPSRPSLPPPPPPITLRYSGFAVTNEPVGTLTAFLFDDSSRRHYNVNVGEILMGRYRIVGITDTSVDIEDLQYNRRQMLPLQK